MDKLVVGFVFKLPIKCLCIKLLLLMSNFVLELWDSHHLANCLNNAPWINSK